MRVPNLHTAPKNFLKKIDSYMEKYILFENTHPPGFETHEF